MNNVLRLVKFVRYPCVVYDAGGKFVYQNEMFSLFLGEPLDELGRDLYVCAGLPGEMAPVVVKTLSDQRLSVFIEALDFNSTSMGCRVLILIKADQDWAQLSLEKMESSRFVAVGQMASGIAHEINNPLTVVLSKLHLIERILAPQAGESSATMRVIDAIHKAQANVYRISKIIKGLRSLARDSGGDPFEKKNLNEVINESIEMCEERIKENGIILRVQLSEQLLGGYMRPYQVAQVIINLVNNAIDALNAISLGEINISSFARDGSVFMRISDSGPGVKAEHENLVMTPFFTTKESGVGTGLGLSISKQIMINHGGNLNMNLLVSRSCFEISIPTERSPVE